MSDQGTTSRTRGGSTARSPNPSGTRKRDRVYLDALRLANEWQGLPPGEDRFSIIRALKTHNIYRELGWTPHQVRLTEALIGQVPDHYWRAGSRPEVWLTQEELQQLFGCGERAVRYHIRRLMKLGVLVPRDSTNCHRKVQYDPRTGERIAFGLDLSPIGPRLPDILNKAEDSKAEHHTRKLRRAQIKCIRKNNRETLEQALRDGTLSLDNPTALALQSRIAALWPRRALTVLSSSALARMVEDAEGIEADLIAVLAPPPQSSPTPPKASGISPILAGRPAKSCRLTGKNPVQPITITNESEIEIPVAAEASTAPPEQPAPQSAARLRPERGDCSRRTGKPPPEWLLLESLSPSIAQHLPANRPVRLADLHEPITSARTQLGVSDEAWERACVAMTPAGAVLAMIVTASRRDAGELEKPAPAYLNGMSKAAEDGELNLTLSLWGVIDRFKRSSAAYQATCPSTPSPTASGASKTFPAERIRQAFPAVATAGGRAEATYPSGFPKSETDMTADRQNTPEQALPEIETLRSLLAATQFMTISQPVLVPVDWQDLATAAERLASELDTLLRHKEPTLHALRAQAEETVGTEAASAAVVITAAAHALDLLRKPIVQSFQDMISASARGSLRLRQRADVVLQALAAERSPSKALAPQLPLPPLESIHSVIQDVDRYWHPSLASAGWPAVIGVARWRVARELRLSDEAWKAACRRMGRHGAAVAVLVVASRYYLATISNPDESLRGMSRRARTGKLHLNRALRDVLSQLEFVRNPSPSPNPAVSLPSLDNLHTLCRAERQITRGILLDDKHDRSLPDYLDHLHPSWLLLIHDARGEAYAQNYLFEPEWRDGCAAIGEHAAAAVWCLASHRHMAAGEGGDDFHIDFFRGSLRMAAAGALDLPRAVEMEVRAVRGESLDELDLLQPGPHADQALELLPDSVCAPPDKDLDHPWGWDAIAQEAAKFAEQIGISPDTWHRCCEAFGKRQAAGAVLYAMPMRGLAAFPDPETNLLAELEDHLDWDHGRESHQQPHTIRFSATDLEREIDRVLVNAATAAAPCSVIDTALLPPLDELLNAADPRIRSHLANLPAREIDLDRFLRAARSVCVDELGISPELWAQAMHVLGPHGTATAGALIAIHDEYYVPGNPLLPGQDPTETPENSLLNCIRSEVRAPGCLRRNLVDEHLSPATSLHDDTDPDVLQALEDEALRAPPGNSLLHRLPTLDELYKVAPPNLLWAIGRTHDGAPDWRRLLAALDPVRRSVLKIPDRSWAQALHILLEPGTAALATFLAAAAHHQSRDPERFWKFDDDEIDLEFHFCIQRELEEPGFLTGEIRELYYEIKHFE